MLAACGGAGSSDSLPSSVPLEDATPDPGEQPAAPLDGPAPIPSDASPPPAAPILPGEPHPNVEEPKNPTEKYDCDTRKITCQTFAPVVCPEGTVPTVLEGCYGKCVPKSECATEPKEPVACAAYIELSDGVCSRPKDDPCRGQDPDCVP